MNSFRYLRAIDVSSALKSNEEHARFLAGGTNLLDLWKMGVEQPALLVDINRLPLSEITELPGNAGVRIGALVRNSALAENGLIRERYPVLTQALLSGASPQIRNAATVGGNLLQRTRCYYFYDPNFPACNKRNPGSGCGALTGYNRIHAILGQSDHCIAVNPSDMCVALVALDATVRVLGPQGERTIPIREFHRLPGSQPERDTNLAPDELVTHIDLPPLVDSAHSVYLKVRDRSNYAFALVSVAAVLTMQDGRIKRAALGLGGVAHQPWRASEAEEALTNAAPTDDVFRAAADRALENAHGYEHNQFKIELARRAIRRALKLASA